MRGNESRLAGGSRGVLLKKSLPSLLPRTDDAPADHTNIDSPFDGYGPFAVV